MALLAKMSVFNPLNAELNPICHLLALLGGATIVVVSRLRVKNNSNTTKLYTRANGYAVPSETSLRFRCN